ncbi:DNA cytosine methyltransferase [Pseudazoarcus pumilus]|uniref:DNA cytosine methyltransferase n=1 Tax=Pseudazoarcus pumilus TaxID=2067960 RepID=UPI002244F699|nr:DNA cytosine methyltransferase [Pseudazoarcus pumilus]
MDLFAGGGGYSVAVEQALGRSPDIAINHNDDALSMHRANHPQTRHFVADVFEVCPRGATQGRPVGLLHLSPDCTHHSQAAGGQPRDTRIRALSWVGVRWAGQVAPRVITLENVKQIRQWGPLVAKRCKATGRVIKRCGSVAEPGERVAVQDQYLVPDARHAGRTWRRFLRTLQGLGYSVEHRILCAADHGAPTTRERLFLVARRDGQPIQWPAATHHKKPARGQRRWRAAAECIDWSIPCPSIFTRPKPLADATLRRIARGVQRYVIESREPFIVETGGIDGATQPHPRTANAAPSEASDPARAETMGGGAVGKVRRNGNAAVLGGAVPRNSGRTAPVLIQTGYGEREGQAPRSLDIEQPLGTLVAGGQKHALVTALLEQANGGYYDGDGHDLRDPMSTVTGSGSQQRLVTAHLTAMAQNVVGGELSDPMPTVLAGASRFGVVECTLSPEAEAGALRVAAFLTTYYGNGQEMDPRDPLATITTRDRLALVTVSIRGTPYVIVDIGLRMLQPHELYAAQGFPADYIITHGHDGRAFTKSAQVRMVGNSVSTPPAAALVAANVPELAVRRIAA